jgi:hypothetical protein
LISWDVTADYSTSNPNGAWSYGYTKTQGSGFTLFPNSFTTSGCTAWNDAAIGQEPLVWKNCTSSKVAGTDPGMVAVHPRDGIGTFVVVRWTAPSSQRLTVSATFYQGAYGDTDAAVFKGTSKLWSSPTTNGNVSFNQTLTVAPGDVLDFVVGPGDGSFSNDTTPISIRIVGDGACGIAGICYQDGQANPLDASQACIPTQSVSSWSPTRKISTVDSTGSLGGTTSIRVPGDARPVMCYHDGTNKKLKVAKCGNAECSSGNVMTAVDTGVDGVDCSLVVATDGLPLVAYRDTAAAYGAGNALKVAKCTAADCSATTVSTVDSSKGPTGGGVVDGIFITNGKDSNPLIAYHYSSGGIAVAHCANANCTSSTYVTALAGNVGIRPSIAPTADDKPVVAGRDYNSGKLTVVKCGNSTCSSGNTSGAPDAAATTQDYSSAVVGTDGFPFFAYKDATNSDIRALKCGNLSCTSANTLTTVDADGNLSAPSVALASNGLPLIVYFDESKGDLKLIRCGNASCSSGNAIVVLDSEGTVGGSPSITVPADGLPVISYIDTAKADLKVLKCLVPACQGL